MQEEDKQTRSTIDPVMHSAYNGDEQQVLSLLDTKNTFDVFATDEQGLNALLYAVLGGHANIIQMLIGRGG